MSVGAQTRQATTWEQIIRTSVAKTVNSRGSLLYNQLYEPGNMTSRQLEGHLLKRQELRPKTKQTTPWETNY